MNEVYNKYRPIDGYNHYICEIDKISRGIIFEKDLLPVKSIYLIQGINIIAFKTQKMCLKLRFISTEHNF